MRTLDDLLKDGEAYARILLLEKGVKQLDPVYQLYDEDGTIHVVPCPWANDFQKQVMLSEVKKIAKKVNCQLVLFVSEGWMASRLPGREAEGPAPSKDPNRIEIVNIIASTTADTKILILETVRDKVTNRIIELKKHTDDMIAAGGPLIDGIVQAPTLH
jgi:hypothetical protein